MQAMLNTHYFQLNNDLNYVDVKFIDPSCRECKFL